LKSLIAYSSVSHKSFMIEGVTMLTMLSFIGGMFMLIAHGITSSGLFAIANIYYERSRTRTLLIRRGVKKRTMLMPGFWLILSCSNLGVPPLPNSMAEIFLFSSILRFRIINIIRIIAATLLTTIFRLRIFQLISSGGIFSWNMTLLKFNEREYLLLLLHIFPLFLLVLNPNIMAV
uniref:proton-conducting transporter transmembrane domain-containing protein n=1 Tax=Salmonella sp. s54836 TaxID=3159673 RepID=UPI003980F395